MTLPEFLVQLQACMPARRGNLYEQYYDHRCADGGVSRQGPYYVWTRCENGKMVSDRVVREDVPRFREELERGERLAALLSDLWKLAEEMADAAGGKKKTQKKKSGRSKRLRVS